MITIGIDPGMRYTGVSVRDGDKLLLSSTYVRPEDMPPVAWAEMVTGLIVEEVTNRYPEAKIGIEGITVPNVYHQGRKNMINPKTVIYSAVIVGSLAREFPDAVVIRPGKNGSQPLDTYPAELKGRRPKDLPGRGSAGTRNHEKSAWDIAGEVEYMLAQGHKLDTVKNSEWVLK